MKKGSIFIDNQQRVHLGDDSLKWAYSQKN